MAGRGAAAGAPPCHLAPPRSSASFARTIRTALRRLCIDVRLRGRWCTLTTAREVLAVVVNDDQPAVGRISAALDAPAGARDAAEADADDDGARIVALR